MARNLAEAILYRLKFWNKKSGEALTNAEMEGNIDLDDAKSELASFTSKVTELVANNMRLKRERTAEQEKFEDLKNTAITMKAELAAIDQAVDAEKYSTLNTKYVTIGNAAVSSKEKIEGYDATIQSNEATIENLKIEIANYQTVISDSKNKYDQLVAENASIKLREQLADAKAGMDNGNSALGKLGKFEDYVAHRKDVVAAKEDINASSEAGNVDSILKDYAGPKKSEKTDAFLSSL